jgi:hypothetical protein
VEFTTSEFLCNHKSLPQLKIYKIQKNTQESQIRYRSLGGKRKHITDGLPYPITLWKRKKKRKKKGSKREKNTDLRHGHAAMVWVYKGAYSSSSGCRSSVGQQCRGRRWRTRTENMGNGLGYIIIHHSLNWSPLGPDPTSNFRADLHRLLWLHLGADHHPNPSGVQLHHHLWLRHYAHHCLSLSLSFWGDLFLC